MEVELASLAEEISHEFLEAALRRDVVHAVVDVDSAGLRMENLRVRTRSDNQFSIRRGMRTMRTQTVVKWLLDCGSGNSNSAPAGMRMNTWQVRRTGERSERVIDLAHLRFPARQILGRVDRGLPGDVRLIAQMARRAVVLSVR